MNYPKETVPIRKMTNTQWVTYKWVNVQTHIPHFITADKAGRLAAFYRSVGRFLKSPRVYELGTYQFDMYAAIMAKAQKAGRE
jgi:hypothetical protein